jgi:Flp pilus assembly protein TadG
MGSNSRTLRGPWLRIRAFCQRLRAEEGSSLVELSLVLSLFGIPLLIGTVEVAQLAYDSIEITNAANAGALYGMVSSTYASDASGIQTAAQTEASDFGANVIVTPTAYYACSLAVAGTTYTTQSAATTACTGAGNHPLEFVKVVTNDNITPPIHFPGLPTSFNITGTSVMEVEE